MFVGGAISGGSVMKLVMLVDVPPNPPPPTPPCPSRKQALRNVRLDSLFLILPVAGQGPLHRIKRT